MFLIRVTRQIVPALAGAILFFSCKKNNVNNVPLNPIDPWDETVFWNTVSGHYKVYDSTGDFIYEMDISRITQDNNDNIGKFENLNGQFTFTAIRSYTFPRYVNLDFHDTLYDNNNKRWTLGGYSDDYYNNFKNDTIPLRFHLTNIKFWVNDVVPYYSADIKQIAVKQH